MSGEIPPRTSETTGPLPLVLGVTGHRDQRPEDVDALTQRGRAIFARLRQKYPHTPLILLSPLAEGADRLVARVAIEENIDLAVPLPWPKHVCAERLHRSGSRTEFDDLLAAAKHVYALPVAEQSTASDIQSSEEHRERHYDRVGAYVARHSEILIALWDGVANPAGGTAKIIRWQREGVPALYARDIGLLDDVENGPVCHIVTPRVGQTVPAGALTERNPNAHGMNGCAENEASFSQIWENIEEFNREAVRLVPSLTGKLTQSKEWLLPEAVRKTVPPCVQFSLDRYAEADALSMRHQSHTLFALKYLFLVVFAAIGLFECYAHLWPDVILFLGLYTTLLLFGAGMFWVAQRQRIHSKYLDYRALAEAMRVQIFWRLAGLLDSAADHYLRNLRSELDWIRVAIRSWSLISGEHDCVHASMTDESLANGLGLVRKHWVEDQRKYFGRASVKNAKLHQRFDWAACVSFIAAVMLAMVQLFLQEQNHLLVVAIVLATVSAALLYDYADRRAFSVHARRYKWMESLFANASKKLESCLKENRLKDAQELVKELGKEALAENGEWVISHRERPIRLPVG